MAEDHLAQSASPKANWTKLFTAFRVALDLKKLAFAAGGIVVTAFGWWLFAVLFYSPKAPSWKDFSPNDEKVAEGRQEAYSSFRLARKRWRLLHELAGPTPDKTSDAAKIEPVDLAANIEEFDLLNKIVELHGKGHSAEQIKSELAEKKVESKDDKKSDTDETKAALKLAKVDKLLAVFDKQLKSPGNLPTARLRSWPWTEDRGDNPYLIAEGLLRKDSEGHRTVPWQRGEFLGWLLSDQLPVLVEPLTKFLAPIVYFFNSSAGPYTRLYLILVSLWTMATWGFFGGAICRIAAVQVARNEKISFMEALTFAKEKFVNLFTAPLFPLAFLGILTFVLIVFGVIHGLIPWFSDIVFDGLMWPVVLLLGLIMSVVVVGLVGWPLMNPTIAAEGSDNFDALSRSFSYVYQAFWHYLGYWSAALVYGAALVFFIGFMGSMVVYLGKWGISQAPWTQSADVKSDRDPSYLFVYAPTSFEWRNLLIKDSAHAETRDIVTAKGVKTQTHEFTDAYLANLSVPNKIGAFLVAVWVGAFFLLVVGFGYSYFWTASTIIYFLMRQYVDDTEFEEVYFEEQDLAPPPSNVVATQTPVGKPNTISLNLVEPASVASATPAPLPPAAPLPVSSPSPVPEAVGAVATPVSPASDANPAPPNPS